MADVITQGVTMVNPDGLDVAQLREELNRVQRESFALGMKLHEMNCRAFDLNTLLHGLVDAYDRADMVAVTDKLQELSGHRKKHMRPTTH